jgi:hypothetical protein
MVLAKQGLEQEVVGNAIGLDHWWNGKCSCTKGDRNLNGEVTVLSGFQSENTVRVKKWEAELDFLTNDLATYMYCLYRKCM